MSQPAGKVAVQPDERLCPSCDYDLRGIQSAHCPECGLLIAGAAALSIPWELRKQMGSLRAFRKTVYLVVARRKRLAAAIDESLNEKAANLLFRLLVTLIAGLPVAVLVLVAIQQSGGGSAVASWAEQKTHDLRTDHWEPVLLWTAGATIVPILPLGIMLSFWLASGAARIFFVSRRLEPDRRRSAITLGTYACAPLVWLPLSVAAYAASIAMDESSYGRFGLPAEISTVLQFVALAVLVVVVPLWWLGSIQLMSLSTRCTTVKSAVATVGIPVAWGLCFVAGMVIFPALVGLLVLMFNSLLR